MTNQEITPSNVVNIDGIGRVHLGSLRTNSQHFTQAAERYLEKLKTMSLVPVIRRGKDNQWFAALEDLEGHVIAFSDDLGNELSARTAAADAIALLKAK